MIEKSIVERIVSHMNEDHSDAVRLYVEAFSDVAETDSAIMQNIDEQGFEILCTVNKLDKQVYIPFEPPLKNATEARDRLVKMVNEARDVMASKAT